MNGYLSRLMEQSGIVVEPAVDPEPRVPAQPPNELEERDAVLPTRVDREELVESRRDDPVKDTREGSEADTNVSGSIVEDVVQDPTEQVLHRKVPETSPRPVEEGQRQSRQSERRELDARDPERSLPLPPENIGELTESGDAIEGDADTGHPGVFGREALERAETMEDATHRADERSSLDARASGEALVFEPGEGSQDRTSRERVWQNTLREVRGWVAGSPVAGDEEVENQSVSRARETGSPFVEERVATSYPKPTAPSLREEPATQDLHLEIGTISVTVEEPQKETPKRNQRPETAKKESAGNDERSRLSRHYVRVR